MSKRSSYYSVAKQLRDGIREGGLVAGQKLPSVRVLSRNYGVSHLTAFRALQLLEKERLIHAKPKSGFYVTALNTTSTQLVDHTNGKMSYSLQHDAPLAQERRRCDLDQRIRFDLASGQPRLYPTRKLGILLRQCIYREPSLLGAAVHGIGLPALRSQIQSRGLEYNCRLTFDEIVVTNGGVEALAIALRAVTRPGDNVLVQSPVYYVLLGLLKDLCLNVVEFPIGSDDFSVDKLERILTERCVKVMVFIANQHNPLGMTLTVPQKIALVELARRQGAVLIEDDVYGDVYFGQSRPVPLRAFDENVILCSSFSKTLSPGIRIGWIAGGRHTDAVASIKYHSSKPTALYPQAAVAEFMQTGGYDAHLRTLRRTLAGYMTNLCEAVVAGFPCGTRVSSPEGGYVLWVSLPQGRATSRQLFEKARQEGIDIAPGHWFSLSCRYDNCIRLNAGLGWDERIRRSVQLLGRWATELN